MLWYHVKHPLLLNKMQLFSWCNKLPWKQESLANTHNILVLVAHIFKTNLVTQIILLHQSGQDARIKLSAKLKNILQSGFRATLNFQLFKVALNSLRRIFCFYSLQKASFWHADYISEIKNAVTEFVFEIWVAKIKIWDGLQGFLVTMVTFYKNDRLFKINWCFIWYQNIAVTW